MKKKVIIILSAIILICLIMFGIFKYRDYKEQERIKNAIVKITLIDDLNLEFNSVVYVSDLITSINGEIVNNYQISTETLGKKTIKFYFINEENIKVPYEITVNIVDKIPPVIWLSSSYTVNVGYNNDLKEKIMCGDNYDNNPLKEIIGEYDTSKVGTYPLLYKATDNSGNVSLKKFNLIVKEKSSSSGGSSNKISFSELYQKYKTSNTKIGIDVSKWQGDIDYEKVKNAGVEFVIIKIGGTNGIDGDYYLDPKFVQNVKGFSEVGIPIGLYFYSYANSSKKAINDALWVIDQIKKYDIDISLPIAYDWENWSSFNSFKMSFYNLTKSAEAFIDTINHAGYEGILYSSKSYLESIWLKGDYHVWLAHYTDKTNYQGDYRIWQMTSSCVLDGISSNTVDVNIMYLNFLDVN